MSSPALAAAFRRSYVACRDQVPYVPGAKKREGSRLSAAARGSGYLAANHVYTEAGRFGEIRNQDGLLAEGVVAEFYVHRSRGAPIGASLSSSDRVASFMVRADSAEELLRKTRQAMQRLDVLDVDGRSTMLRDVYLKALRTGAGLFACHFPGGRRDV